MGSFFVSPGGEVLASYRLVGMAARWGRIGVASSTALLEWGRTFSRVGGGCFVLVGI